MIHAIDPGMPRIGDAPSKQEQRRRRNRRDKDDWVKERNEERRSRIGVGMAPESLPRKTSILNYFNPMEFLVGTTIVPRS